MKTIVNFQSHRIISLLCFLILFLSSVILTKAQTDWDDKKREGTLYYSQLQNTGYRIGKLLKETDSYKLYGYYKELASGPSEFFIGWCAERYNATVVSIVFKADAKFQIDNNEIYWKRFEDEMLPAIISQCPDANDIFIANYADGFQINYRMKGIGQKVNPDRPSDALSIALYSRNQPKDSRYKWFYGKVGDDALNGIIDSYYQGYSQRNRANPQQNSDPKENENEDRTLTSIARLQELWKSTMEEAELAYDKERQEFKQKLVEEQKQKVIEKNRIPHREKASEILKLYKKGAGQDYNFVGYTRQQSLQNIYKGNFEEFTGGYEQSIVNETVTKQTGLYTSRAPLDDIFKENKRLTELMLKIAQLRAPIMIAYFAYHQAYEGQCSANKEIAWMDGTKRVDLVDMRGAIEVSRIRGNVFYFSVREPFYNTFVKSLNVGTDGLSAELLTGTPSSTAQEFQNDFVKFIKKEGCASAKVRHLETNLYLATEWLLPLQELLPPEMLQGQTIEESQKPQPEVKKTPVIKKPTVKKRRKN